MIMQNVRIEMKGIAAELVLGNYMPADPAILKNWEDFYHYNDLIHVSHLLAEYLEEINIYVNNTLLISKKKFPAVKQKSISPVMQQDALYLRTECVEKAEYAINFETEDFLPEKLRFETQDYDGLFRTGNEFVVSVQYKDQNFVPEWISGQPLGNLCVLCAYDKGYLVPVYDAILKKKAK